MLLSLFGDVLRHKACVLDLLGTILASGKTADSVEYQLLIQVVPQTVGAKDHNVPMFHVMSIGLALCWVVPVGSDLKWKVKTMLLLF